MDFPRSADLGRSLLRLLVWLAVGEVLARESAGRGLSQADVILDDHVILLTSEKLPVSLSVHLCIVKIIFKKYIKIQSERFYLKLLFKIQL